MMNPSRQPRLFVPSVLLGLLVVLVSSRALAQKQPNSNPANRRIHYELKEPPPTGNPTQTSGAGSRGGIGNCPAVETPLTALVPKAQTARSTFFGGKTLEARPTIWVYVPYALTPHLPGELRLRETDTSGNQVNTAIAQITGTSPGVIGIRLPSGHALAKNQLYTWSFVVLCDLNDASANQFVKAAVQRIAPDPSLVQQLKHAQFWDRAALYARSGLWYDMLTVLAAHRYSQPSDVALSQEWNSLLESVGLDDLVAKAIVQSPGTAP